MNLETHQLGCRPYVLARGAISLTKMEDAFGGNFKNTIKYLDPRASTTLDLDISTINTHTMATEALDDTINN